MKKLISVNRLVLILVVMSIMSLMIGVKHIDLHGLVSADSSQWNIVLTSRIPRTLAIILSGAALSVCGLIMQQLTQNKFVSPTTAGTMEWSKLGVVVAMLLFSHSGLQVQLIVAMFFGIFGTLLFVYLLRTVKIQNIIFIPLLGIMLGKIVSSITTFLGVEFNLLQSINTWLQGNFAVVTSGRYEYLFFVIPCLLLTFLYAQQFTIAGLGEDFAKNLGLPYRFVVNLGLILVAIMTSIVVIIVGSLPFLGLIVPNIVSRIKGDHLKGSLLITSLLGAVLVMFCDLIGRLLIFPYEISVGLTMGVIGSVIFLYFILLERQEK